MALFTYLVGFWCYLFLTAIAAWPRLPFSTWFKYVLIKAGQATFWPVLVAIESFGLSRGW